MFGDQVHALALALGNLGGFRDMTISAAASQSHLRSKLESLWCLVDFHFGHMVFVLFSKLCVLYIGVGQPRIRTSLI